MSTGDYQTTKAEEHSARDALSEESKSPVKSKSPMAGGPSINKVKPGKAAADKKAVSAGVTVDDENYEEDFEREEAQQQPAPITTKPPAKAPPKPVSPTR